MKNTNYNKKNIKGGQRARSTTLCLNSPNMDNGAVGNYGFHPVWGSSCCGNTTLNTQRSNLVSEYGVAGGKPITKSGGKRNTKKKINRITKKKKIQSGSSNLKDVVTSVKESLNDYKNISTSHFNYDCGSTSSSTNEPSSYKKKKKKSTSKSKKKKKKTITSSTQTPNSESSSTILNDISDPFTDVIISTKNSTLDTIFPSQSSNNNSSDESDSLKIINVSSDNKSGGSKNLKSKTKKKIKRKQKKKISLKGGKLLLGSNIDNPFNCLIHKYQPQTNWVQFYSPLATSNFPIVQNGLLPHNNKYSWNQEG